MHPRFPPSRPPISVIIPTWNTRRYLPACLTALQAQLEARDEIIVVDNGSRDRVDRWIGAYAPEVRVVRLPYNRGFAGGTNAGMQVARGELLLLCNDDALVEPGCVDALCSALWSGSGIGMVGGVLTFSHHPTWIASAGILVRRDGVATDLWAAQPLTALPPTPREIFGASGGLALIHRALLDDVGPFAESFFSYLEDVDLAWRARLRGWRSVVAPGARARHVSSASGGMLKPRLLARNRIRVIVRCIPTPLLIDCFPWMVRYDFFALVYGLVTRQSAIVAGRLSCMHEIPELLAQRRTIQSRATVSFRDVACWLEDAPSPWTVLQHQQHLRDLINTGRTTDQ